MSTSRPQEFANRVPPPVHRPNSRPIKTRRLRTGPPVRHSPACKRAQETETDARPFDRRNWPTQREARASVPASAGRPAMNRSRASFSCMGRGGGKRGLAHGRPDCEKGRRRPMAECLSPFSAGQLTESGSRTVAWVEAEEKGDWLTAAPTVKVAAADRWPSACPHFPRASQAPTALAYPREPYRGEHPGGIDRHRPGKAGSTGPGRPVAAGRAARAAFHPPQSIDRPGSRHPGTTERVVHCHDRLKQSPGREKDVRVKPDPPLAPLAPAMSESAASGRRAPARPRPRRSRRSRRSRPITGLRPRLLPADALAPDPSRPGPPRPYRAP